MEDKKELIESLFERVEQYGKTSIELYRLKAIDKSADIVSSLTSGLAVGIIVILFFLILNIALGLWIGEILGRSYYGFFMLSGFYGVLSIFLYVFRNQWIKIPVSNSIINHALK